MLLLVPGLAVLGSFVFALFVVWGLVGVEVSAAMSNCVIPVAGLLRVGPIEIGLIETLSPELELVKGTLGPPMFGPAITGFVLTELVSAVVMG